MECLTSLSRQSYESFHCCCAWSEQGDRDREGLCIMTHDVGHHETDNKINDGDHLQYRTLRVCDTVMMQVQDFDASIY